jgi:NarL family two-component system response regulator LiaR
MNMAEKKPIRVLLVDDHAVVRSGLSAFLLAFDDLELAGEAGSGEEAVKVCSGLKPDVVLMDLSMPGMGGVEATKQVLAKCPGSHVIVLTSFKEKDMVEGALKAGALSYLLKNVTADELASAIRGAAAGRPSLSPEAAQVLIHDLTSPEQKCGSDLTQSEREVLALMVEGLSNKEIAERSDVSQSTVKFHVSNILSKLGVGSRTEAVAYAIKNKLVK